MFSSPNANAPAQHLTQLELDEKPWKYIGYKEFARYASSDDDFFALRRFDRTHCRLLLLLQDEVVQLEEQLDALDAQLSERSAPDTDNGSFRADTKERREILQQLLQKVNQYDELCCRYIQLKTRPRASKTVVQNMKNWLANNNGPIHPQEAAFIDRSDLISVARSQKSTFRHLFEQQVLAPTSGLFGALLQTPPGNKASDRTTIQGSDEHVDVAASILIFISATVMLVVPLWILAILDHTFHKLATITVFLVVFLAILTWGTLARPFEILAATAGYSAVLVVFLQIGKETGTSTL